MPEKNDALGNDENGDAGRDGSAYFLKYSFPCAGISLAKGQMNEPEYEELKAAVVAGKGFSEEKLARMFPNATRRLKVFAKEKCMKWDDPALIREYFWVRHQQIIDKRAENYEGAPDVVCELCKVLKASVIKVSGEFATVRFENGKQRNVLTEIVGELKVGDSVMVHQAHAVEVVE